MFEFRLPFKRQDPIKDDGLDSHTPSAPDASGPNRRSDFLATFPNSEEATRDWIGALEQELLKPVGQRDRLIVGNSLFVLAYHISSDDRLAIMYEKWYEGILKGKKLYGEAATINVFIVENLLNLDFNSGRSSDNWYVPGGGGIVRLGFEFTSGKLLITNRDSFSDKDKLHAVGIRCSSACDHLDNS